MYQFLVTFFNFLGTLPKVMVQLPIQFTIKIIWLKFYAPQNAFSWHHDKNFKNGPISAIAHARCKNFLSKNAEYPSSYLLSIR